MCLKMKRDSSSRRSKREWDDEGVSSAGVDHWNPVEVVGEVSSAFQKRV